jgi:hypothetical protein
MPLNSGARPLRDTAVRLPINSIQPAVTSIGDRYVVAGYDGGRIAALRVSQDGAPLDLAARPVASMYWAGDVTLTSNGRVILVTWQTQSLFEQTLSGAILDRDLGILHEPFVIATRDVSTTPKWSAHSVASDGDSFLIAWEDSIEAGTLTTMSVSETASVQARRSVVATLVMQPRVTTDGSGYVIAWHDGSTIQSLRVDRDGSPKQPATELMRSPETIEAFDIVGSTTGLEIATVLRSVQSCGFISLSSVVTQSFDPQWKAISLPRSIGQLADNRGVRIDAVDRQAGVVWDSTSCDGHTQVLAADAVDGDARPVTRVLQPSQQQMPALASDGITALLAWAERRADVSSAQIFASVLDGEGRALSERALTDGTALHSSPRVAFDGLRYLVVWHEVNGESASIRGRFVSGDGEPQESVALGPADAVPALDVTYEATSGFVVAWADEGVMRASSVSSAGNVTFAGSVSSYQAGTGIRLIPGSGEVLGMLGTRVGSVSDLSVVTIRAGHAASMTSIDTRGCSIGKCTQGLIPVGAVWNGSTYTASWSTLSHPAYPFELNAMSLLAAGAPAATSLTRVPVSAAQGPRVDGTLVRNRDELLVVLRTQTYRSEVIALRMSAGGQPLDRGTTIVEGESSGVDAVTIGDHVLVVSSTAGRLRAATLGLTDAPRRRSAGR